MITLDCKQGSQEWLAARIGIPTASCYDKIITPKTRKPSASADRYIWNLLAEWLTGQSLDESVSQWMERGTEMESEAVQFYELHGDMETERIGFCLRDDRKTGCSPDRTVGVDGLLEIKCPSMPVHIGYMLNPDGLEGYACQAQGQLYITGRQWVDLLSYNPELPPALVRYYRDEELIRSLSEAVDAFLVRLDLAKEKMLALGCAPAEPPKKVSWSMPMEVTP